MSVTKTLLGVALGAVCVAGAFGMGRWAGTESALPSQAPPAQALTAQASPVTSPAPPPTSTCAEVQGALDAELERTRVLEMEQFGEPARWPDEAARARAEAELNTQLAQIRKACLAGPWHWELDCQEDPCIAVLEHDGAFSSTPFECFNVQRAQGTLQGRQLTCEKGPHTVMIYAPGGDPKRNSVRLDQLFGKVSCP